MFKMSVRALAIVVVLAYASLWVLVPSHGGQAGQGSQQQPYYVVGPGADAAAIVGNPVRVGGTDGTNTRSIFVDSAGVLILGAQVTPSNVGMSQVRQTGANPLVVSSFPPYTFTKITTNVSLNIKSSPAFLHSVVVSSPGTAWTIQIFDNSACSGTAIFGGTAVTVPAASTALQFDVATTTGLCVTTAGTTPGEITVIWR